MKRARELLAAAGVPYKRPDDFLCEMVKADSHMDKVMGGELILRFLSHLPLVRTGCYVLAVHVMSYSNGVQGVDSMMYWRSSFSRVQSCFSGTSFCHIPLLYTVS